MEKSKETEGRRRWSPAERAQWVREYRASGLSQEQFAAQAQLSVGTLRGWIYPRAVAESGIGRFAAGQIVGGRGESCRGLVTVRWPHGVEVELAVNLDEAGTLRLVQNLVAPCSP